MKIQLGLVAALGACLFTTAAHADDARAGDDEVVLKNGGTVRGTLTTVEPGKTVRIVEGGSSDVRVFAWAEVAQIEKAKYAATSKPAKPAQDEQAATPDASTTSAAQTPEQKAPDGTDAPNTIRVHIESPVPADLYRYRTHVSTVGIVAPVYGYYGYGTAYVGAAAIATTTEDAVCSAPCDKEVPAEPGDQFVLKGDFPSTKKFGLSGDHPDVTLAPGSNPLKWGGIAAMSAGGVGIIGGIIALGIGAAGTVVVDSRGLATTEKNTGALAIGGTMVGLGAGLVVGGIVMAVESRSHVQIAPGVDPHGRDTALSISPWVDAAPAPADAGSRGQALANGVVGVHGSF